MPIEMQLSRIIISEINESQYIFLKEVGGDRQFPIVIGIFEATSIDRRVKKVERPRPLTHDLIVNIVETMGGEMDSVVITELKTTPTLRNYESVSKESWSRSMRDRRMLWPSQSLQILPCRSTSMKMSLTKPSPASSSMFIGSKKGLAKEGKLI